MLIMFSRSVFQFVIECLLIFDSLLCMQNIVEILKLNVPMAMKIALDGLLEYNYKTRDTSISDVGNYEKVEVSVSLCNDDSIQNLNKEWRGEDCATDMLSVSQYIPDLDVPTVRTKQHF